MFDSINKNTLKPGDTVGYPSKNADRVGILSLSENNSSHH